jgi:integrase
MATVVKRGKVWRAVIRKDGNTETKGGFASKAEGKRWAHDREAQLAGKKAYSGSMTLAEIFYRYGHDVVEKKPYDVPNVYPFLAVKFGHVNLQDMDVQWWLDAINSFDMQPQSRSRYFAHMKSALTMCEGWGNKVNWEAVRAARVQLSKTHVIGESEERDRRVTPAELAKLRGYLKTKNWLQVPIADCIEFALLTGLREAEITRINFADVTGGAKPMLVVRARKHPRKKMSNHSTLPLLGGALDIINRQPRTITDQHKMHPRRMADIPDGTIFPFHPATLGRAFRDACRACGIKGLRFHDLRHEAISRLFEAGFDIPQVALVSGHKNWKNLRRYTNLDPVSLHDGPAGGARLQNAATNRPRLRAVS